MTQLGHIVLLITAIQVFKWVQPVPEPGSYFEVGLGILGIVSRRREK